MLDVLCGAVAACGHAAIAAELNDPPAVRHALEETTQLRAISSGAEPLSIAKTPPLKPRDVLCDRAAEPLGQRGPVERQERDGQVLTPSTDVRAPSGRSASAASRKFRPRPTRSRLVAPGGIRSLFVIFRRLITARQRSI